MAQLPRKDSYKLSEVCQHTDTQPYVLRFWESEFPQLNPGRSRSGQPVYSRRDIDLVQRIKHLLYEEEYTLDGARKMLEEKPKAGAKKPRAKAQSKRKDAAVDSEPPVETKQLSLQEALPRPRAVPDLPAEPRPVDTVERERYEAAVEEVDHLRLTVREAEKDVRRAELARDEAQRIATLQQDRAERVAQRLEQLLETLS